MTAVRADQAVDDARHVALDAARAAAADRVMRMRSRSLRVGERAVTARARTVAEPFGTQLAARIAVVHAVAGRARERPMARARGLQQALILVRGQARGAVRPETRSERLRVAVQRGIARERRAVARQILARHEAIARSDALLDVRRDALAVATTANLRAAGRREPCRVGDRSDRPAAEVQNEAPQRIAVVRDVALRRPMTRLAGDAELGHARVETTAFHVEPGIRRDVVAVHAVIVPARDVPVVIGALHRRAGRRRRIGRQKRAVHVHEARSSMFHATGSR